MSRNCFALTVLDDRVYWLSAYKRKKKWGTCLIKDLDSESFRASIPPKTPIVMVLNHPYESIRCMPLPTRNDQELQAMSAHQIKSMQSGSSQITWEWVKGSPKEPQHQTIAMITCKEELRQKALESFAFLAHSSPASSAFVVNDNCACSSLQGLLLAFSLKSKHVGLHLHFDSQKILMLHLTSLGFENFRFFHTEGMSTPELCAEIKSFYQWNSLGNIKIQVSGNCPSQIDLSECTNYFKGELSNWSPQNVTPPLENAYLPLFGVCQFIDYHNELPHYQVPNQSNLQQFDKALIPWCWSAVAMLFFLSSLYFTSFLRLRDKNEYSEDLCNALRKHYTSTLAPGAKSHFSEITFAKTLEKQNMLEKNSQVGGSSIRIILSQLQEKLSSGPDFQLQEIHCSPPLKKFSLQGTVADLAAYEELDQRLKQNKKWSVLSNFTRSSSSKRMDLKLQIDVKELP
jgi:hypothetical protein